MRNHLMKLFAATVLMLVAANAANATETSFAAPKWKGDRLDWCLNWSTGCGKQTADAFCKASGYQNAVSFTQAPNIGSTQKTRLIATGAVCDQNFCDGFKSITCFKPSPATVTINKPMWKGDRLDWCLNWSTGCGKGAADTFARRPDFRAPSNSLRRPILAARSRPGSSRPAPSATRISATASNSSSARNSCLSRGGRPARAGFPFTLISWPARPICPAERPSQVPSPPPYSGRCPIVDRRPSARAPSRAPSRARRPACPGLVADRLAAWRRPPPAGLRRGAAAADAGPSAGDRRGGRRISCRTGRRARRRPRAACRSHIQSELEPKGDQPSAIAELVAQVERA